MFSNLTLPVEESDLSPWMKIVLSAILACICVSGVIGNCFVLIVAFRKQNYHSVTNCYIINLALTDLLFLLLSVPLTTYLGLTNRWILNGIVSCRVHIYLAHVLLQATCYTLAVMSIDRYLYVINSNPNPRWRRPFNASILCILIWIVSIAFVFPYKFVTSPPSPNDCSISSSHPLFASCLFPFGMYYVFPLVIIALCYSRLFCHMRKTSKSLTRHRTSLPARSSMGHRHRRVTRTLFSLTCAFAVCWFPIHLLELLNCRQLLDEYYQRHSRLLDLIRTVAHALSYFNSCLNPFLYALFNKEFFL